MPPNTTEWECGPKDLTWRATTELPNTVTDPQAAERIRKFYAKVTIPTEWFARTVAFAMGQPEEVDVKKILFQPTRQEIPYRSRQTSLMSNPIKGTIWRRTEEVTRKGCLRNPERDREIGAAVFLLEITTARLRLFVNKLGKALNGADSMLVVSSCNS